MGPQKIPSLGCIAAVEYYRDLMLEHGPDSLQAREFFVEWKDLDGFAENAKQQYQLAKDDYEEKVASRARKSAP
jgi:hypothetical protein